MVAGHLAEVHQHERGLQRVAVAERVPRVHHRVVPDADVDAGLLELLHAGVAAPDRPGVEASLQHGVVQRVGHHVQAGPGDVADQPVGVRVVVGMHGRGVAGRDPAGHAPPDRLGRHHLDEARVIVVGLVAVDVHAQAMLVGERHRELDRLHAVLAGQLVVRDPADHVRAQLDGLAHQLPAAVEARGCPAAGTRRAAGRSGRSPPRAGRRARAGRAAAGRTRRRGCGHAGRRWPAASAGPGGPVPARPRRSGRPPARPRPRCPRTASRRRSAAAGPTVRTASRWMCGSTSGGVTRRPARSMVSAAVAPASTVTISPPAMPRSVSSSWPATRALRRIRSIIWLS